MTPPNIGDPIPTPRVKRDRPRDPVAMQAVDALCASPEGQSIPVTGFDSEEEARKFGGRVQGYMERDHGLHVRTNYHREDGSLILTVEVSPPEATAAAIQDTARDLAHLAEALESATDAGSTPHEEE